MQLSQLSSMGAASACGGGAARSKHHLRAVYHALVLFLFLLWPLPQRANPVVLRLPFRNVRSLILIEGKINGNPANLVLDTGTNHTIVSKRCYGAMRLKLRSAQHIPNGAGMAGESVSLPVNLVLADHMWAGQRVLVMDLDELQRNFGVSFDGLLGQDVLREFRSVRIDYPSHIVELEN